APLLEKEGNLRRTALTLNVHHPFPLHGPCAVAAFTPDDDPIDSSQIDRAQVFQQRLDGKKRHGRFSGTKIIDAREPVLAILNAYPPPDVRQGSRKTQLGAEQFSQPL